jgi:hypothetical protein
MSSPCVVSSLRPDSDRLPPSIGSTVARGQKETDASERMTNVFGRSLCVTTLLDELSGFMKAERGHGAAFPLVHAHSVTRSKGA